MIFVVKHFWNSVDWVTLYDLWKYDWVQADVFMRVPKKSAVRYSQTKKWPAMKRNEIELQIFCPIPIPTYFFPIHSRPQTCFFFIYPCIVYENEHFLWFAVVKEYKNSEMRSLWGNILNIPWLFGVVGSRLT